MIDKNILYIFKEKITNENFISVINKINEFSPKAIYIQPSVLLFLVNNIETRNLKLTESIKYIETTGELLDDTLKKICLEKLPKIKIVNMYGTEENNAIAFECPYHKLHILEENVYMQTIDNDVNGYGKAIITNLNNKVFPLIKYNVGDIIKLSHCECQCGKKGVIIDIVEGRIDDVYYEKNLKLSSYSLSNVVFNVNNYLDFPIIEYKFRFITKLKKLEVFFVLKSNYINWKHRINQEFTKIFNELIGLNCTIVFNYEEEIYVTNKKNKVFEVI